MEMEQLKTEFKSIVDKSMEENLPKAVGPMVAAQVKSVVESLRLEKAQTGTDRTGLTDEQKKTFAVMAKSIARGSYKPEGASEKSGEALIEEQDERGGFLVPKEIANAILRVAASVGLVTGYAQKWSMKSDELGIPSYQGDFLEGEYLGVDKSGDLTAVKFTSASLIVKKWQLAFAGGNDLIADASVQLADWLLALAGEALANRIDKEGLTGSGKPFVGVLNHSGVSAVSLPDGSTDFDDFDPITDAASVIGEMEESVLDGCGWIFHRTVWAKIRSKKDGDGRYILPLAGAMVTNQALLAYAGQVGGRKPVGEMAGYPVFTCRHLPSMTDTAVSTKFGIFGNLKALAYGDRGDMRLAQFTSGSFGGKEIATADQIALIAKHRHAVVVALPAALKTIKTAAH